MYIADIDITTELGNMKESREFESSTDAMNFAIDFVKPHLQQRMAIYGEWVVYEKDSGLVDMRSNQLVTDYQQRVERLQDR